MNTFILSPGEAPNQWRYQITGNSMYATVAGTFFGAEEAARDWIERRCNRLNHDDVGNMKYRDLARKKYREKQKARKAKTDEARNLQE